MEPNNEELKKAYEFKLNIKKSQEKYRQANKEKINLRRREYHKEQKFKDNSSYIENRRNYMQNYTKMNKIFPQMQLIEP